MIFGVNSAFSETCGYCAGEGSESLFSVVDAYGAAVLRSSPAASCAPLTHTFSSIVFMSAIFTSGLPAAVSLVCRGVFLNDGGVEGGADGAAGNLFVEECAFGFHALHLCGHGAALGVVGFGLFLSTSIWPVRSSSCFCVAAPSASMRRVRSILMLRLSICWRITASCAAMPARRACACRRHRLQLCTLQHRHGGVGDGDDGAALTIHALGDIHYDDPARGLGRDDNLFSLEGAPGIGITLTRGRSREQEA